MNIIINSEQILPQFNKYNLSGVLLKLFECLIVLAWLSSRRYGTWASRFSIDSVFHSDYLRVIINQRYHCLERKSTFLCSSALKNFRIRGHGPHFLNSVPPPPRSPSSAPPFKLSPALVSDWCRQCWGCILQGMSNKQVYNFDYPISILNQSFCLCPVCDFLLYDYNIREQVHTYSLQCCSFNNFWFRKWKLCLALKWSVY